MKDSVLVVLVVCVASLTTASPQADVVAVLASLGGYSHQPFSRSGPCPNIPAVPLTNGKEGVWYSLYWKVPKAVEFPKTDCMKTTAATLTDGTLVFDSEWLMEGASEPIQITSSKTPIPGKPGKYLINIKNSTAENDPLWGPYIRATTREISLIALEPTYSASISCYSDGLNHELMGFIESTEKSIPHDKLATIWKMMRWYGLSDFQAFGTSRC